MINYPTQINDQKIYVAISYRLIDYARHRVIWALLWFYRRRRRDKRLSVA